MKALLIAVVMSLAATTVALGQQCKARPISGTAPNSGGSYGVFHNGELTSQHTTERGALLQAEVLMEADSLAQAVIVNYLWLIWQDQKKRDCAPRSERPPWPISLSGECPYCPPADTIPEPPPPPLPDTLPTPPGLTEVIALVDPPTEDSISVVVSWDSDGFHDVWICCRVGGGDWRGSPYPPRQTVDGSETMFGVPRLPEDATMNACVAQRTTGTEVCASFPVPGQVSEPPPLPPPPPPPPPPSGDVAWGIGSRPAHPPDGVWVQGMTQSTTRVDWGVGSPETDMGYEITWPGGRIEQAIQTWIDLPEAIAPTDTVCVAPGPIGGPYDQGLRSCDSYWR